MGEVILKPSREKSLIRHHPWVFSGAISELRGRPKVGEVVDVLSSKGAWLARGSYSPSSQIRVRAWTFDPAEKIDASFFRTRIERALSVRQHIVSGGSTDAFRIVNSESDGLPGLIVDLYAGFLVCQFLTAGSEYFKDLIVSELAGLVQAQGIYERSDVDVRLKEGLKPVSGLLAGSEPPALVRITENGCIFLVDVRGGHKTGFYLDQRDNRRCLSRYAAGKEVLNCFSYTGGFGIAALMKGSSHVVNMDSSAGALALCAENARENGLDPSRMENVEADVFSRLRQYRDTGRRFDIVVLDPPKFAESKDRLMQASRGYKDINLLAFQLIRPGGFLFTFSCSGLMEQGLFQKIVADAALDAGREARIIHALTQSSDHVVSLNFPEGSYLKGLVCSVW